MQWWDPEALTLEVSLELNSNQAVLNEYEVLLIATYVNVILYLL